MARIPWRFLIREEWSTDKRYGWTFVKPDLICDKN